MKRVTGIVSVLFLLLAAGVCRADPVPFQQLLPLLPAAPAGWTAEKPEGQTMKSPFEASSAMIDYMSGDKRLEVSIFDGGPQVAAGLSYLGQVDMESTEQSIKSIAVQGFKGMLVTHHADKEVELIVAVAGRFIVSLHLTGVTDAALVQDMASRIDFKKLASLGK